MFKNIISKFFLRKYGIGLGLAFRLKDKILVIFNFEIGYGELSNCFAKGFYLYINPPQLSFNCPKLFGINLVIKNKKYA